MKVFPVLFPTMFGIMINPAKLSPYEMGPYIPSPTNVYTGNGFGKFRDMTHSFRNALLGDHSDWFLPPITISREQCRPLVILWNTEGVSMCSIGIVLTRIQTDLSKVPGASSLVNPKKTWCWGALPIEGEEHWYGKYFTAGMINGHPDFTM